MPSYKFRHFPGFLIIFPAHFVTLVKKFDNLKEAKLRLSCLIFIWNCSSLAIEQSKALSFFLGPSKHVTKINTKGKEEGVNIQYRVLVPPHFPNCRNSNPCYNAVYFLHGRNENSKMLESMGALETIDSLYQSGIQLPYIIVSPDGGSSYWMNAALEPQGKSRWASMITEELLNHVQLQFPQVRTAPENRALVGISMGGHGALQIGFNFPGLFKFVAAHSPVLRGPNNTQEFHDQFGDGADYEARDPLSILSSRRFSIPPFLYLWVNMGERDPYLPRTKAFMKLLDTRSTELPFSFQTQVTPGGDHSKPYWQSKLKADLIHYRQYFEKGRP